MLHCIRSVEECQSLSKEVERRNHTEMKLIKNLKHMYILGKQSSL
jgi:hypothetical protein